jgi:hypothetical protein
MTMQYTDVADVLDAVADYIDGIETQKKTAEAAAKGERISKLAARFETSTGESIPASMKEKLASLDTDTLDQLLKVAKNTGDSPAALGSPADREDAPVAPRNTKEASAHADDRFLSWLTAD